MTDIGPIIMTAHSSVSPLTRGLRLSSSRAKSILLSAILAQFCAAQRTIIVDAAGGAGFDYRTIAPAVDAAQPGDTVLVRAGVYDSYLIITKGIRLIGQNAALNGSLGPSNPLVRDLPAAETFTMRGFRTNGSGIPPRVVVRNCAGVVSLRDLRQNGTRFGLNIENSRQVHVADAVLPGVFTAASNVVFERVVIESEAAWGLRIQGGSVDCSACTISGGYGIFSGPGIGLYGGRVRVTQSTVTGTAGSSGPNPAISTDGGEVHVDPTAMLRHGAGVQPITGPALVVRGELAALRADSDGAHLISDLHGPANADFVTVASVPSVVTPTPFGDLWLSTVEQVVVDFGTLDSTRRHQWSLAHPPVPSGLTITMQSVTFTDTFGLSMPTIVSFP